MPLPTDAHAADWPPPTWAGTQAQIDEARLWYTGSSTELRAFYAGQTVGAGSPQAWRDRVKFWARNRRTDQDTTRGDVHYPAAAKVANTAADLLFGEPITLAIPDARADQPERAAVDAQARLDELLEDWQPLLQEGAEVASGLGGVYLRPLWDLKLSPDRPLLTVVHQDHAIPTFRHGILTAVIFWRVVETDSRGKVWRHLELHEPGRVEHGLYEGTARHLGTRKELADHADTAGIAADPQGVVNLRPMGITGLLPEYVPNRRPNRRDPKSQIGCADTAGFEPLMDMLDSTVSSWLRDLDLGKRRIIVPDEFLTRSGPGGGAWFDTSQEVFSPLNMDPMSREKASIEVVDFAIRAQDHDSTMGSVLEAVVTSAGYSPQSFGLHGDGAAQTATEVDAREGLSERTTAKKRRYWAPALARAAEKMLRIDAAVHRTPVVAFRPVVEWPTAEDDPEQVAGIVNLWSVAGAASVETRVRTVHPEWDDDRVAAEVEAIRTEQGTPVDDPTGGMP